MQKRPPVSNMHWRLIQWIATLLYFLMSITGLTIQNASARFK
jgi:hypothetical protein